MADHESQRASTRPPIRERAPGGSMERRPTRVPPQENLTTGYRAPENMDHDALFMRLEEYLQRHREPENIDHDALFRRLEEYLQGDTTRWKIQYRRICPNRCARNHTARAQQRHRRQQRYREVCREFDPAPLVRCQSPPLIDVRNLLEDQRFDGVEVRQGRRYIRWRTVQDLDDNNTNKMTPKIRAEVNTSFYLRQVYSYQLGNIENGDVIVHYTHEGSPWFNNLNEAEKWLNRQEAKRLELIDIKRPSTK